MLIGLTGTPGTGKTSTSNYLGKEYNFDILHLNQAIKERELYEEYDQDSGSYVVDTDKVITAVNDLLEQKEENKRLVIEGHLAHHLPQLDLLFVLRTDPSELEVRMQDKGWKRNKIEENLEAEALDLILQEALKKRENNVPTYEVNTTNRKASETAAVINNLIEREQGEKSDCNPDNYRPGSIDWSNWLTAD